MPAVMKRRDNIFRPRNAKGWEADEYWFILWVGGRRKTFKGYKHYDLTCKLKLDLQHQIDRSIEGLPPQTQGISLLLREHMERLGFIQPRPQGGNTISILLADYHKRLLRENNETDYCDEVKGRLTRLFDGCGVVQLSDIKWKELRDWIADLEVGTDENKRPASAATRNHYAGALRTFGEWLLEEEILEYNPFVKVKNVEAKGQEVVVRRVLSMAEYEHLLAATARRRGKRSLVGYDRMMIYMTALATGLRAQELASLTPESFDFKNRVVVVRARDTKNKELAAIPIHGRLLEPLQKYLAGKPTGQRIWPGQWWRRAAEMLRPDLRAAGIAFEVNGERVDFHSFRHAFNTHLGLAEVDPRVTKELARHSTLNLTMRYTHLPDSSAHEGLNKLKLPKLPGRIEVLPDTPAAGPSVRE